MNWMIALMGLSLLAVLVVLIAGMFWLDRNSVPARPGGPGGSTAKEVLRRRYVAGEVDDDVYRQRLGTLRGHHAEPGRSEVPDRRNDRQP